MRKHYERPNGTQRDETKPNASIERSSILALQLERSANQVAKDTWQIKMDDEKLVELVHHFPCLWQVSCKEYKDTRAKENAWKEIAGQVSQIIKEIVKPKISQQAGKGFKGNIEECQRRWKTIRDRFVRELKKVKARKTGDEGPPYKPTWPLFETLLFLQDTVRHRQ